ncbi:efflux RND transporter permease subunit [Chelativorans sp. AA-79]|uniref:efflux RND transporter permease subunit n=1 Tax=Chelativorans sp. AA-79 TaxID=3028735 RepID=UPI0023F9824D|nr:efflux RND transporter permease subunit [Chelativorans sp. AA-79]WEX07990.1 efflux RND transporter permease subunit [Chelativorans sp. AA-79]
MGKPAYEASEEAASEIGLTVIAISFSIVAVFAPVSFMSGIAGQFFKQFGITVAVAVLFSLLTARLITPMFAAYFLNSRGSGRQERDGWITRSYMRILAWTLRHRAITLIAGLVVFAASIDSATSLPTEFVPPTSDADGDRDNEAIMPVEFALQAAAHGSDRVSAMMDAGHKRARPIVMTTVAMVAGMVPSALAQGAGGEFRAPMAIAVIGGLLLSTLLSLLFVPSLFSVLERLKDGLRWLLVRLLGFERTSATQSEPSGE